MEQVNRCRVTIKIKCSAILYCGDVIGGVILGCLMTRKNLMSIPCLLSEVIKYFWGGFEKRKTKTIQKNPKNTELIETYLNTLSITCRVGTRRKLKTG